MTERRHDLVVVGGGPAGLAAAATAAGHGLDTVLMDEQPSPGGQIYRNVEANADAAPETAGILGGDYSAGLRLVEAFRESSARFEPLTSVWQVEPDGTVGTLHDGRAALVRARRVIVAAGAMERPMPIPGWTLPGVMTAGAAQTLLKGAGLVPDGPAVLAGNGPLLYLVAWQLVSAGVEVRAILDTTPRLRLPGLARDAARRARPARRDSKGTPLDRRSAQSRRPARPQRHGPLGSRERRPAGGGRIRGGRRERPVRDAVAAPPPGRRPERTAGGIGRRRPALGRGAGLLAHPNRFLGRHVRSTRSPWPGIAQGSAARS